MLTPTSPVLVASDSKKNHSLNTIKIDFAKISFIPSTKQNFTQCQSCKAFLTIVDKKQFSCKQTDDQGKFIWICRFCKQSNKNEQLYFVSSNFRHCISEKVPSKIVPPIMLFLIDISGSMTSSIFNDLEYKKKKTNEKGSFSFSTQIKKIIEDSIMRKNEVQYLKGIQRKFGNNTTEEESEHFSKLSFLFSIIEYHLKTLKSKKHKSQYRVGFIFFSDTLVILKGAKQKSIPMYVHQTDIVEEFYPLKTQRIDFNDFGQLFQKGRSYDRYFGDSKFSYFDVTKLAVQYIRTGGKTALGPALVLASGIISEHDQGSKIILVTDSDPNYGIFSCKKSQKYYNKVSQILKQNNATMGIFRLLKNKFETNHTDSEFQSFIKANPELIKIFEISLDSALTQQTLDNTVKALKTLITHETIGESSKLIILNDNPHLNLVKFKYDNLDFRNLRFLTSQSKHWIQVQFDENKIEEKDFLFPTMTQLILQYDDLFSKQRCLFMSYTSQNLIRTPHKNQQFFCDKQSILAEILEQVNKQNIQTLFDLQCLNNFEKQRKENILNKKTFRNELRNRVLSFSNNLTVESIECQNINDYTQLKNKIQEQSDQPNSIENCEQSDTFEQQYQKL